MVSGSATPIAATGNQRAHRERCVSVKAKCNAIGSTIVSSTPYSMGCDEVPGVRANPFRLCTPETPPVT